jgi:hypothetical protein
VPGPVGDVWQHRLAGWRRHGGARHWTRDVPHLQINDCPYNDPAAVWQSEWGSVDDGGIRASLAWNHIGASSPSPNVFGAAVNCRFVLASTVAAERYGRCRTVRVSTTCQAAPGLFIDPRYGRISITRLDRARLTSSTKAVVSKRGRARRGRPGREASFAFPHPALSSILTVAAAHDQAHARRWTYATPVSQEFPLYVG